MPYCTATVDGIVSGRRKSDRSGQQLVQSASWDKRWRYRGSGDRRARPRSALRHPCVGVHEEKAESKAEECRQVYGVPSWTERRFTCGDG